ncbi:MAG: TrmH family RNA methyltransferase [Planctomycetota bacterium]
MASLVRCPSERCSAVFEVQEIRLGRNIYCLECGTRMTAKAVEVDPRLESLPASRDGSSGDGVARLPFAVVLDNIRSLWNVGSMFRTADACAVERLFLTGITGTPPAPRLTKTALGAEESVQWDYERDPHCALDTLHAEGYELVALERSERAEPIDTFKWPTRVGLVVGNEVSGVAPSLLEKCQHVVGIPMSGSKESLNVAVAFGIAAHRVASSLRKSSRDVTFR